MKYLENDLKSDSQLINNMIIHLDGKTILTEYDFHCQIAKLLDFGEYYGNNLDALWDRLTDVELPVTLIWDNSAISRQNLGEERFAKIIQVFQDMQEWDERFKFELR